ncbi:hypothetical protein ENBRE01_2285 [Enteropsectra breve]|nr:hypothetical protein ENBRE01_2285 [Enteropsectra breve]
MALSIRSNNYAILNEPINDASIIFTIKDAAFTYTLSIGWSSEDCACKDCGAPSRLVPYNCYVNGVGYRCSSGSFMKYTRLFQGLNISSPKKQLLCYFIAIYKWMENWD